MGPTRQSPSDAPADAIERVSPRLTLERGDVALIREALPRVNPTPISTETQWRYRVCVEGEHGSSQFFNSFAAAAARAEEIATERSARLLFVEDGVVSLLADYRRLRGIDLALPLRFVCNHSGLHGEICCLDSDGRTNFKKLLFRREWPHYAFDVLSNRRGRSDRVPLLERKRRLLGIMLFIESRLM